MPNTLSVWPSRAPVRNGVRVAFVQGLASDDPIPGLQSLKHIQRYGGALPSEDPVAARSAPRVAQVTYQPNSRDKIGVAAWTYPGVTDVALHRADAVLLDTHVAPKGFCRGERRPRPLTQHADMTPGTMQAGNSVRNAMSVKRAVDEGA